MGNNKKGSSNNTTTSWLTAVKRAFRSPTKDQSEKARNCRRKGDQSQHQDQAEEEEKKREKRRWLFRKASTTTNQQEAAAQQQNGPHQKGESVVGGVNAATATDAKRNNGLPGSDAVEQRHAIAVAVATAAAAEAAVASAQAAMEVARLTRHPTNTAASTATVATNNSFGAGAREHYYATVIQTAFRGYLARRALRALKGLVKLQALVRGHNVRKQAKMTLKCMQALVRVQARVLDQRLRMSSSQDGGSRKSTFSDTNSLLESRYIQEITERRSVSHSREPSSIAEDWDERPHTIEEVKAMLQSRKEAVLKREKSLSHAFHQQMWRGDRSSSMGQADDFDQDRPRWLDRWMATKQWERNTNSSNHNYNTSNIRARASTDHRARVSTDHRDPIKIVEMDTSSQPYSYLAAPTPDLRRPAYQRPSSPLHNRGHQSPITPSPSRTRPIQVRSASPRCSREERAGELHNLNLSSSSSQTPSLRSNYYYNGNLHPCNRSGAVNVPNYMAATESAKARVRSQSAPRQRPSTPERERGGVVAAGGGGGGQVKKRLAFPAPNTGGPDPFIGGGGEAYAYSLRSPSFKSLSGATYGFVEQQSNYSSCCTESLAGGEISPSSTTDLRRWLR